jgi:Carboxypeptidase regulatory-like domain
MTHPSWLAFSRTAVAAAVAVVAATAAAPVLAQNTTSAINGVVTGADGKPVAGATVTIVHTESGSTNTVTTDEAGRYSARGLRAGGPYTITVRKGELAEKREGVFVNLAETFAYDAVIGSAAQVVTVTGRGVNNRINRSNMGAGTAISSRDLESFASIGRSLQDYARTDPRLSQTDKNRGEVSAAGQNSRYNSITIDSVRVNDTFGLEPNGLPTIKQPISIDAIQAIQVNISNYDVTQQGYTGANINAVTKSGTNEFKGSVYYVYRDDDLAGDRFFNRPDRYQAPPVFKDTTAGFTLGGPIVKDRLFFFASYEELKSNRNKPVVGPLGSGLAEVGISAADIAAAQGAARARGFDIGEFDTAGDLSVKDTLLKLDWNISDRHRANLRYTKTEEANPIFPGYSNNNNTSSLSLSSRNFITSKNLETVVAQVLSDWTDNLSTEFKYSVREYTSEPLTNSNLPEIQFVYTNPPPPNTPTGNRTLRVGTEETRHFNRIETNTTNLYLAGNLNLGAHEVKLGADIESNEVFNAFVRRAKGQYTFQGADPAALLTAGNPTAYRVQVARAGFSLNDAAADVTFDNTGLFVQDTWTFNRQLRMMGGVRVDTVKTDRKPIYNAAAQAAFGLDNSNMIDGERLVQPRFGFNYRHEKEDKLPLQVRGGFGLFQGNAATVWLVNPYQNSGMVLNDFSCSTTTTPCPAGLFTADPNNPATLAGNAATSNVDFLAPGTEQPSVWKMSLAFDTELSYGLTLGAEWLYTRINRGLAYRHLNLGGPTTTSPTDGRQLYWNAGGLNPACWLAGDATPSTSGACATNATNPQQRPTSRFNSNRGFADVLVIESTDKGKGNALTVSLSQALREWGINWSAAYTRTSATEVSPLTSSTSFSQWANRAAYNPNEAAEAPSSSLIRNRINLSASWSKSWTQSTRTTFGVFYEARSGRNYSWTYNNDANGDGVQGNDLLYVPRAPGSGEVLFKLPGTANTVANSGAAAEARFWSVVSRDDVLNGARGTVVGRNSSQSKITQNFDVRMGQEFRGFLPSHRASLTLDILNFANLLNKKWGRIEELSFSDGSGGRVRRWINYSGTDAQGRAIYTVNDPFEASTANNSGESAWAAQLTFRYAF